MRGGVPKGWFLALVIVAGGCGFQRLPSDADLGGDAGTDAAGDAGVDPGGDLGGDAGTDAGADLAPSGPTGPGPLGALPAGYCCSADDQCRSRSCLSVGGGPKFCSDECSSDGVCNVWGGKFVCAGNGTCVPQDQTYGCLDPETYVRGTWPTGACCTAGHPKSGQECAGGWCISTGPVSNPFFCTQGCSASAPCPAGYACNADNKWCWKIDPNAPYTCDP